MTRRVGSRTRVLLLVEDNEADAVLVQEYLEQTEPYHYEIHHAVRLADAVLRLQAVAVDIILLDLSLPDSAGRESVQIIRAAAGQIPIVVLTGSDDEKLALSCIDAGAQDYLFKEELRPTLLRRAVNYAITRRREAQIRALEDTLERYRALSSVGACPPGTPAAGSPGPLRERLPEVFAPLTTDYLELLRGYLEQLEIRTERPRELMEHVVTRLGDAGAGPRDLVDLHVAALDEVVRGMTGQRSRSLVVEGRLLALEMMALLVDYYRVGLRRRSLEVRAG